VGPRDAGLWIGSDARGRPPAVNGAASGEREESEGDDGDGRNSDGKLPGNCVIVLNYVVATKVWEGMGA
jgi:hypothetical protein